MYKQRIHHFVDAFCEAMVKREAVCSLPLVIVVTKTTELMIDATLLCACPKAGNRLVRGVIGKKSDVTSKSG